MLLAHPFSSCLRAGAEKTPLPTSARTKSAWNGKGQVQGQRAWHLSSTLITRAQLSGAQAYEGLAPGKR